MLETSIPRLVAEVEVWDVKAETYSHTVLIWEKDSDYFHHQVWQRHYSSASEFFGKASIIPRAYHLAKPAPGLTVTSVSQTDPNVFLKKTIPYQYDPNQPEETWATSAYMPAALMLHEAQICEEIMLKNASHPNIIRYYGYLPSSDGKEILGLCLERYSMDLLAAIDQKVGGIDSSVVIDGIRKGIEHLHALGYVHNDINPANILLNSRMEPVIADFDSCQKVGVSLKSSGKAGTFQWDHESDVSMPQNDFFGLEKIKQWLEENNMKEDLDDTK
ncbi:kinase-like domain-containing protein [Rhodocollybia butyracea]|uniref:Kinase-like domain-containing protein n=1 Tax=Rhodocollybia butyracea TaxID=206335 RepID=A0A9P5PRN1_9AGAR|nr:kinase-like domain-containing protein [Rhodocollybia butyracea]